MEVLELEGLVDLTEQVGPGHGVSRTAKAHIPGVLGKATGEGAQTPFDLA